MKIGRLKKNSSNSSKPPSSDIVKPRKSVVHVGRRKRKRGGRQGHRKYLRLPFGPDQADEVIEHEFNDKDAKGLTSSDQWFILQQIKLPGQDFAGIIGADYWGVYRKYVRLFNVRAQYCMAYWTKNKYPSLIC